MEYIKPEEFLKQPKKVQETFRNWWKPEQYDLFMWDVDGLNRMYIVDEYKEQNNTKYILPVGSPNIWNRKEQTIPLFTEGQLRMFIENKIKKLVKISTMPCNYYVTTELEQGASDNLLKAYWQVACKIASKS